MVPNQNILILVLFFILPLVVLFMLVFCIHKFTRWKVSSILFFMSSLFCNFLVISFYFVNSWKFNWVFKNVPFLGLVVFFLPPVSFVFMYILLKMKPECIKIWHLILLASLNILIAFLLIFLAILPAT